MKNWIKLCFLICLAVTGSAALAAINGPTALAVNAKGELYVANFNANQIQVYSLQHSLIPSRTITQDVSGPMGVGLDPRGNVWVANFATSSLTAYTPAGTEFNNVSYGISNPTAMAIDAVGSMWVVNGVSSIAVIEAVTGSLVRTDSVSVVPGATLLYSVSTFGGTVMFGNDSELYQLGELYYVYAGTPDIISEIPSRRGIQVAYDTSGNAWVAEQDGSVYVNSLRDPWTFNKTFSVSYSPNGMVVDSPHKLIYLSHNAANSVDVYTTKGKFVTTIH
jgi:hypothetical protein